MFTLPPACHDTKWREEGEIVVDTEQAEQAVNHSGNSPNNPLEYRLFILR